MDLRALGGVNLVGMQIQLQGGGLKSGSYIYLAHTSSGFCLIVVDPMLSLQPSSMVVEGDDNQWSDEDCMGASTGR